MNYHNLQEDMRIQHKLVTNNHEWNFFLITLVITRCIKNKNHISKNRKCNMAKQTTKLTHLRRNFRKNQQHKD